MTNLAHPLSPENASKSEKMLLNTVHLRLESELINIKQRSVAMVTLVTMVIEHCYTRNHGTSTC